MSAVILAFPPRSPVRALMTDGRCLAPFSAAWCAQHLPLIDAGLELLEADDEDFASRCALMRDTDGRAMLEELAGQLQRLGTHIADVADALGLTAARILDAMSARRRPNITSLSYCQRTRDRRRQTAERPATRRAPTRLPRGLAAADGGRRSTHDRT